MELRKIKYRQDIDGIRALAVLSVVINHVFPQVLVGGFLGVDIFFVISGYLITLLLLKEHSRTGTISFKNFYYRRIKRIYPAFLFFLISVALVSFVLFLPHDFQVFLQSMQYSLLFSANFFFNSEIETGYFASSSLLHPLLHLWSLSIEEQFYIIWPVLVLFFTKKFKTLLPLPLILLSLSAAVLFLTKDSKLAYYMLPSRAWELLVGAFTAYLVFFKDPIDENFFKFLEILGGLSILLSLYFINESYGIPGFSVVPLIFGTAAIIYSGHYRSGPIYKVLSNRFFVYIGRISYSFYLWHWGILSVAVYSLIDTNLFNGLLIIISALGIASFSFHFVESPLRFLKISFLKCLAFYLIIPTLVLFLLSWSVTLQIKNRSSLYPWLQINEVAGLTRATFSSKQNCQSNSFKVKYFDEPRCIINSNKRHKVVLVGDSNAAQFLGALTVMSDYFNFSLHNNTQSACPLLLSEFKVSTPKAYQMGCDKYREFIFKKLHLYDTIILGGKWDAYSEDDKFQARLKKTLTMLKRLNKNIVILAQIPKFRNYDRNCFKKQILNPFLNCDKKFNTVKPDYMINNFLKSFALSNENFVFLSVRPFICKNNNCSPSFGRSPLYYDSRHLSFEGSRLIGKRILESKMKTTLKAYLSSGSEVN